MKRFKNVAAVFIFTVATGLSPVARLEAADLFLNDEPELYEAIDKLNALGYLPGILANTRPYSVQAIRNAAQAASRTIPAGTFEGDLLRWVAAYTTPKDMARLTATGSHAEARFVPANNQGIPRPEGWSALEGFSAREEVTPVLSGQFRAAFFQGEHGDDGGRLLDASIEVGRPYFSVQAGTISTWYGPGRHGSLILSNNAQPYPGVRIHNPEAIPLTGWAKLLGRIEYDFFAARMEQAHRFPHHTFVGTRVAARPARWLEVGASRILHYGGEGRSDGVSEFLENYFGSNEPPDRSNTLAGIDVTLMLRFRGQPLQGYWEHTGEGDNRLLGVEEIPWPTQFGNIYGLYLPALLGSSRLDLRAEYADNFSFHAKEAAWYDHSAYPHRYRGEILGHAMGGSARDWFVEGRYWLVPASYVRLSWERVLHDDPARKGERRTRYSAGITGWLTENWRIQAEVLTERVTAIGGVPGADGTDFSAFLSVGYQVTTISPWGTRLQRPSGSGHPGQ